MSTLPERSAGRGGALVPRLKRTRQSRSLVSCDGYRRCALHAPQQGPCRLMSFTAIAVLRDGFATRTFTPLFMPTFHTVVHTVVHTVQTYGDNSCKRNFARKVHNFLCKAAKVRIFFLRARESLARAYKSSGIKGTRHPKNRWFRRRSSSHAPSPREPPQCSARGRRNPRRLNPAASSRRRTARWRVARLREAAPSAPAQG